MSKQTLTIEELASKLEDLVKSYHKGMKSLKVETRHGIIVFIIKSKRSAQKIQMDMLRSRVFSSVVLQYWDSEKTYAVQAAVK